MKKILIFLAIIVLCESCNLFDPGSRQQTWQPQNHMNKSGAPKH